MNEHLLEKELTTYDRNYEPTIVMYDNQPYTRDISLCNWDPPQQLFSGNVVKFYQYKMRKPVIIQTPDEDFEIPEYRKIPLVEEASADEEEMVNDYENPTDAPEDVFLEAPVEDPVFVE
jgi:hypothetical protein